MVTHKTKYSVCFIVTVTTWFPSFSSSYFIYIYIYMVLHFQEIAVANIRLRVYNLTIEGTKVSEMQYLDAISETTE